MSFIVMRKLYARFLIQMHLCVEIYCVQIVNITISKQLFAFSIFIWPKDKKCIGQKHKDNRTRNDIKKTLHRNLKTEQNKHYKETRSELRCSGYVVLSPLVACVLLLLNDTNNIWTLVCINKYNGSKGETNIVYTRKS